MKWAPNFEMCLREVENVSNCKQTMKPDLLLVASLTLSSSIACFGEVFVQYFPGTAFTGMSENGNYALGVRNGDYVVWDQTHGTRVVIEANSDGIYPTSVSNTGNVAGMTQTYFYGNNWIRSSWVTDASLVRHTVNHNAGEGSSFFISANGEFATGVSSDFTRYGAQRFSFVGGGEWLSLVDQTGRLVTLNPLAISYSGSVIAGLANGINGYEAFRWTEAAGSVGIGTLRPGAISRPYAMSPDGSMIIGTATTWDGPVYWDEAFVWTQGGGMEGLGTLPGQTSSAATGVSADGIIVGRSGTDAFIYTDATGMRLFGDDMSAAGISGDGTTIVGTYADGTGFIAHDPTAQWLDFLGPIPVPEPSDYAVCFAGASALFVAYRRIAINRKTK